MKRLIPLFLSALSALVCCGGPSGPVDAVDPTIGGVSVLLETTRQTVHLPNQMLRFVPLRADMLDDWIDDFALQMADHRRHWVFGLMPFCTADTTAAWSAPGVVIREETHPHYYRACLDGVTLEFAPAERSGIVRITFEGEGFRCVRLRTINPDGRYVFDGKRTVSGTALFGVGEAPRPVTAYLHAEFDRDVTACCAPGGDTRHLMVKADGGGTVLQMRYGLSYISPEQARENLAREIPDFGFEAVRARGRKAWEKRLGQIEVEGGTPAHLRTFYTALYRCSERMVDISEYGAYYSAWDRQVHPTQTPFYVDNWVWDTHIALEPLHTLLNPGMEVDKIRSFIEMYRQSGIWPRFALTTGEWPAMTGNYAAVWLADAWEKGLRFDLGTAYEGLRKNALERTLLPWRSGPLTPLDTFYHAHGYYPALPPGAEETVPEVDTAWERRQAVSITTTTSYCDWALARLARILGKEEDEALFTERSGNWRNVFREDRGMMWPKDAEGQWIEPYNPLHDGRAYFTENNAYIFNWDVKHDLTGLIGAMGGRGHADAKLDELFHMGIGTAKFRFFNVLPDATGLMGMFQMGNEPGFHIPYLYAWTGAPWKTQKYLHDLIDTYFTDTRLGMPGDEDGGGMSAFLVFSMCGFFPVTPGSDIYVLGSPFFARTTLHLPDGKTFTVKARHFSETHPFIQRATLNGRPLAGAWLTHRDLLAGGVLELTMGPKPCKEWGADVPPPPPAPAVEPSTTTP